MPIAVLISSASVFAYMVHLFWPFTVDDAFIGYRYSMNLASGFGPTWNPGLPPIEGYTGILWILIMTVPHLLGLEPVLFAKTFGIIATVAYMAVAFCFVRRLAGFLPRNETYLSAAMAVFMLAVFPGAALHAVSGIETALYTLLLTLFYYEITVFVASPSKGRAFVPPVLGLLVGLTRPEGNLAVIVGLCATMWMLEKEDKKGLMKATGLVYVAPGALYFSWRLFYYRILFPLPFYVKVASQLFSGVRFQVLFLGYISIGIGALVLLGLVRARRELIPAMLSVASLWIFFLFPYHLMNYEWRFNFPTIPLVFVIAALGIANASDWVRFQAATGVREPVTGALLLLAICLTPLTFLFRTREIATQQTRYGKEVESALVSLGKRLCSNRPADHTPVIAMSDIGAVAYYSGWRVVDLLAINEPHLALTGRVDPQYVLSQNPDVIVLTSRKTGEFEPCWFFDEPLYLASLARGMRKMKTLPFQPDYNLWILAYPDSPIAKALEQWE
ncbi:MAG TPA: hypothetical protein VKO18_01825 [Terriglobia bacterium]|nr:hypothetical protein [Terriglobia bacterium]